MTHPADAHHTKEEFLAKALVTDTYHPDKGKFWATVTPAFLTANDAEKAAESMFLRRGMIPQGPVVIVRRITVATDVYLKDA